MCVLACRLELICVCVDDVVRLGLEPWRGLQIYILAEGLKIEFFGIIR